MDATCVPEIPSGEVVTRQRLCTDLPVHESAVLAEVCNSSEPLGTTLVRNCDDIRKVAWSQAAADSQLNSL
jgi:hypothetical protein